MADPAWKRVVCIYYIQLWSSHIFTVHNFYDHAADGYCSYHYSKYMIDRQTDRQTDKQTDRQIIYSHTDSTCTNARINKYKPVLANNKVSN